jgi:predicted O-linked N-acetylglucosamine transferase (SPINDLY family)
MGLPSLGPSGLPELIADSWDDYVDKATHLTADFEALDTLRSRVLAGFEASPTRDEVGFTRNLEAAFRQMFASWCAEVGAHG